MDACLVVHIENRLSENCLSDSAVGSFCYRFLLLPLLKALASLRLRFFRLGLQ